MRGFATLLTAVALALGGTLAWDLMQERLTYPGRKLIVYAGMFGPGEPMQQFYAGPNERVSSPTPLGPEHGAHRSALAEAWPRWGDRVLRSSPGAAPLAASQSDVGEADAGQAVASATDIDLLVEEYRSLHPEYVDTLMVALDRDDRSQRLRLFHQFARLHPRYDGDLIQIFERLHPAYTVGVFEDFERLHPDHKIVQRWDGRWVLSANRPRFLTGSDVPDLISGSQAELRILMRENLGLPVDRPLTPDVWPDDDIPPQWRERGILASETHYDDPNRSMESVFYDWVLDRAQYEVSEEDHQGSGNPYPVGTRVGYLVPRMVQSQAIFVNRAHLERIGRERDDYPRTVAEFEAVCRQLRAAGIEPIAQDGMSYGEMWWQSLVWRTIGQGPHIDAVLDRGPRFSGPEGDPRYLSIARRLRQWRDDGFWMSGFSASQWPGAQRDFGAGRCTFLLTGTWLPAEIQGTRSWDPEVFDLGCFFFPSIDEQTGDPHQVPVGCNGYLIPRDGDNHAGAVLLLRYLTARTQDLMAHKLGYMPVVRGVPFPEALQSLEPFMASADLDDFLADGPQWYSAKWYKFVFREAYNRFFVERSDATTPVEFLEDLERRSQQHYTSYGPGT